jgi:hypothetical protein
MGEHLGSVVESRGVYEATVAACEHLRGKSSLEGSFSLVAPTFYEQAVRELRVPKRPTQRQREDYVRERREFVLVQQEKTRGVASLLRPTHTFEVLTSDVCVACGGEVVWKPKALSGTTCGEERVCTQCGVAPRLQPVRPVRHHVFGAEERGSDECRVRRVCTQCGYSAEVVRHSFAAEGDARGWRYERDGRCTQTRACTVCGQVETRVVHVGEWEPDGEDTVADGVHITPTRRVCERCGELERDADCWVGPA